MEPPSRLGAQCPWFWWLTNRTESSLPKDHPKPDGLFLALAIDRYSKFAFLSKPSLGVTWHGSETFPSYDRGDPFEPDPVDTGVGKGMDRSLSGAPSIAQGRISNHTIEIQNET